MARKSKEFRELFHQDSVQERRPSRPQMIRKKELEDFEHFKQEIKSKIGPKALFVENPQDFGKISETLIEFVLPFLEKTKTYQERLHLFELAVIAWNLALLPEEERHEVLTETYQDFNQSELETLDNFKLLAEQLIERKLQFFAKEKRSIDDFKLTERSGRIHISVASSLRS